MIDDYNGVKLPMPPRPADGQIDYNGVKLPMPPRLDNPEPGYGSTGKIPMPPRPSDYTQNPYAGSLLLDPAARDALRNFNGVFLPPSNFGQTPANDDAGYFNQGRGGSAADAIAKDALASQPVSRSQPMMAAASKPSGPSADALALGSTPRLPDGTFPGQAAFMASQGATAPPTPTMPALGGNSFSYQGMNNPKNYDKNAAISGILQRIMGDQQAGLRAQPNESAIPALMDALKMPATGMEVKDRYGQVMAPPPKSFSSYLSAAQHGNTSWDMGPGMQALDAVTSMGHDNQARQDALAHQGQVVNALIQGGHLDLARKQFDALAPQRSAEINEKTAHANYLDKEGKWREAEARRQDALADPKLQAQLAQEKKRVDRGKLYADYLTKNPGDFDGAANAAHGSDMLEQGKVWNPGKPAKKGEHHYFSADTPDTPATPGTWTLAPPAGMKQVGTASGKPVFEDAQGKRYW